MALQDWFIVPDSDLRTIDLGRYHARLNERIGAETIAERAREPYNPERFTGEFDDFHREAVDRPSGRLRSVPKKALPG